MFASGRTGPHWTASKIRVLFAKIARIKHIKIGPRSKMDRGQFFSRKYGHMVLPLKIGSLSYGPYANTKK